MNIKYFYSISFSICALLFVLIVLSIYIPRRKTKTLRNLVYLILLISNAFGIVLEFVYMYFIIHRVEYPFLTDALCKAYLIVLMFQMFICLYYVVVYRTEEMKNIKKRNKLRISFLFAFIVIFIICSIINSFLDVKYFVSYVYYYSGPSADFTLYVSVVVIITTLISLFAGNKKITRDQYLSVFTALFMIGIFSIAQFITSTDFNWQSFQVTLFVVSLYFALENQDLQLLAELEESKIAADAANNAQTEFLSNMSHEIRTPMNTILGFSESLLKEKDLTEEIVKRDMKNIHMASVSLLALINNILDISRIESDKEKVVEKEYDLQDLIFEINSLFLAKLSGNDIKYNLDVDPSLPRTFCGDAPKIIKAVTNILINALNYTSYGEITLRFNKGEDENGNFLLKIIVENTGHAMKEEDFGRSFEDFMKLGSEEEKAVDSVTLGLLVSKSIVEMLNGRINFKNEVGHGTQYFIYLPEKVVDEKEIGNLFDVQNNDLSRHEAFDLSGKKVLVVDDNRINLKLASRLLEAYQVDFDSCLNGNECIEKVKNNHYDIIFLDHMMPDIDGVSTLKLLKSYGIKLPPVIALTANSYNGAKETYIEEGFSDYLAKPISYKDLNKLMYKYFRKNEEKVGE